MNQELTKKIRHDFDRLAPCKLEQLNHNNNYHPFLLDRLPTQYEKILDLGFPKELRDSYGTGEFFRLLSNRAEKAVAIDLSCHGIQVEKLKSSQP